MKMTKTIKWGMVGTGNVTEVKSGPGFTKAKDSQLLAVTNRTHEKAVDYAKRHNIPLVYNNIDDMIKDKKVDAIYLATPPNVHLTDALKCAKAGIPTYIEKPVAMTYQDHTTLMDAFYETNTPVWGAYYRRGHERFIKLKELLEQQSLGNICFIQLKLCRNATPDEIDGTSWRIKPQISGGGLFMDLGVHQLDIMNFIFGDVTDVQVRTQNLGNYYEPEDTIFATLTYQSGITLTATWCFVSHHQEDLIEIVGEKGRITLSCFGTDPLILQTDSGTQSFDFTPPQHVHQPLIQTIVDELNGGAMSPSPLHTSLNTAWVCDCINGY